MLPSLNFSPGFTRPAGISGINFSGGGQKAAQVNPAFRRDSVNLGNAASRFQLYTSTPAPRERWCISNYFTMSPAEASSERRRIWQELDNTDFSGMTNLEIYEFIENKFIETFGENFMMAQNLGVPDPIGIKDPCFSGLAFTSVGGSFRSAVNRHIVGSNVTDVTRQRLFGDKSDAEIKATVRANYPERLTNRDLRLMLSELESVGLRIMTGSYFNEIVSGGVIGLCGEIAAHRWVQVLDKPVDFDLLFASLNNWLSNARGRGDLCSQLLMSEDFFNTHLGMSAHINFEELFDRLIRARFQFREVNLEDELLEIMDERDLSVDEVDKQEKEIEYLDDAVEDSLENRTTLNAVASGS